VALPKWTQFVTTIKNTPEDDFNRTCLNQLQSTAGLNEWFSPIDPMISISQQEICDLHSRLFASLRQKGIQTVAEYVSFSYIVTLDLFLNANQQEDYENCVNYYALNAPKLYCADLTRGQVFSLWSGEEKATACEHAATEVASQCDGQTQCDSCAVMLASAYQSYQTFVNDKYSGFFQQYEKKIFASLDAQNKIAETKH
jgi:ferredoxin